MGKDWAETREMGRKAFIWKKGVLGWGILTAILMSVMMYFIFPLFLPLPEPWWKGLLIAFVVFPFAGYFWGLSVWNISEKKFNANQETNDS